MKKYIIEDFYKSRPPRIYKDYAPCIRADRQGLKVIESVEESFTTPPDTKYRKKEVVV